MKILALTDLHSEEMLLEKLNTHLKNNKYDCIFICGDIITSRPLSYVEDLLNILKNQRVFAVTGNCDPNEVKVILKEKCIENKNENIKEYNITGMGGSLKIESSGSIYNVKTEEEFQKELNKLNVNDKTILLSHCPPFKILDKTARKEHIGSKAIRDFILEKNPLLFICGHVHEEVGKIKINNTTFINLPPAKELKAGIITINKKVDVEFINL